MGCRFFRQPIWSIMNGSIFKKSLKALLGLTICGCGEFLMINSGIGMAPWETLTLAVSGKTGLSYGVIYIFIGVSVVIADLLLKEKIGIGTLLDCFWCGIVIDLIGMTGVFKTPQALWLQIPCLLAGIVIQGFGLVYYIGAGLCCGPRDALLVGIGKRLRHWKIGMVNMLIQITVFVIGVLLGGPFGIGTIIATFGLGPIQQGVFDLMHFEPRDVVHEGLGFRGA